MQLEIPSFANGAPMDPRHCLMVPAAEGHQQPGENVSPALRWTDVPGGTQSFALICVDPDAPTVAELVNQEDRSIPHDLPRADFHHWVLVDIPADVRELPEGADGEGFVRGGKPPERTAYGLRGTNDYTGWFAGDSELRGTYAGYDGPAPPWNDERVHRYRFQLHALDVHSLGLAGTFTASDVRRAMAGHVLATAEHMGTWTLNAALGARERA